jgi:GTP cyclohydrolase I
MKDLMKNFENADDFDDIVTPSDESIESYKTLIKDIGEDLKRDGLVDTPKRAAAAFKFLNHGYKLSLIRWLTKLFLNLMLRIWSW